MPRTQSSRIRHDIYPARGRKQAKAFDRHRYTLLDSPRYLPRKGTETAGDSAIIVCIPLVAIRHDIYPARGRKRWLNKAKGIGAGTIRHDIYPARGRKRVSVV